MTTFRQREAPNDSESEHTLHDWKIHIVPLAPNLPLPRRASPRTRTDIPAGYGVQEQCLPFTAATGLGVVIPSPIRFGHCPAIEVPQNCRAFASPISRTGPQADWMFYVEDNPSSNFERNAYSVAVSSNRRVIREPGISFFDREDQQDLFKLHLPYIWRTPPDVDTLFLPLMNGSAQGLEVQSGLVETDWYANGVNMILRKPSHPVHFRAGELVAQAIFVPRQQRNPEIVVQPSHSRLTREVSSLLIEWHDHHARNRSAYKVLARSHHGRIE